MGKRGGMQEASVNGGLSIRVSKREHIVGMWSIIKIIVKCPIRFLSYFNPIPVRFTMTPVPIRFSSKQIGSKSDRKRLGTKSDLVSFLLELNRIGPGVIVNRSEG